MKETDQLSEDLSNRLVEGMEEVIEHHKRKQEFWKKQAEIYLVSTMKTGANGAVFSARVKSSWRPEWMRGSPRVGRGKWMVGMTSPGMTTRQERAMWRQMNKQSGKKWKTGSNG